MVAGFASESVPRQRKWDSLGPAVKWLLCFVLSLPGYLRAADQPRLAVPSYVSPTAKEWNVWASLGSQTLGIMIINLNNGDDTRYDAAIAAAVKGTQESGILVLAYVYTRYSQRDPAEIRAKIDGVFESTMSTASFWTRRPPIVRHWENMPRRISHITRPSPITSAPSLGSTMSS